MKIIRWLLVVGLVLIGIGVLSYLQGRFDQADLRKAIHAVQVKFPRVVGCEAEMVSRWRGQVQVRCEDQRWFVDVVKGVIGDENGK